MPAHSEAGSPATVMGSRENLRARYRREADIPWDVLAPALEALDEAHFGG